MQSRNPSRIVALAIGLCALALALTGCGGGHAQGMKAVWTLKGESPDDLALYWTQRRMASAKPYEPGLTNAPREGPNAGRLPYVSRVWGFAPTTGEGGRVVGKVFFEERGVAYFCTGTAVFSDNRSVVLTAGHCAADGGTCAKGGDCRPHQNWIFVPSFRQDKSCDEPTGPGAGCPYGRFAAKALFAPDEWLKDGNHRYDYAAVVVEALDGRLLTDVVGDVLTLFYAAPETLVHRNYALFGYPKGAPFKGRLWVCVEKRADRDESRYEWFRGSTRTSSEPGPAELTIGCNMTAGADGGPWLTPGQNRRTAIVSVSSFSPADDRLSGPYFGEVAKRTFELAAATKVDSGE
jgi:hypothetical protein